ncbi:plant UBX domain-containing protein 10-like [Typha latifolia]|uniref:plant UBX domain-containing protein 10-like n=1 Tax=Typha latifolia TaxID=4733 RepID=UPI003C30E56F
MADASIDKLYYFQDITGIEDSDLCMAILAAHNWDLDLAASSVTSSHSSSGNITPSFSNLNSSLSSLSWNLATLPFYAVSGGIGLLRDAVGLGVWLAGGAICKSLDLIGFSPPYAGFPDSSDRPIEFASPDAEAAAFVAAFEREFGSVVPRFADEGFTDALRRSQRECKLLFVYLHSPDHEDVAEFCKGCLCSAPVAEFLNENFVAWGGSIRRTEGFQTSKRLMAFHFPFCGIVKASSNEGIVLLQQIEGPKSPEQLLTILQWVVEDYTGSLVAARLAAEELRNNRLLREEQDTEYISALEADQARERQMKEEQERLEREAAEAERKREEEEEAQEIAAREAAEKEAALARKRQEKAMSLGAEPEKGPGVTQVLIRFPTGERKERRFYSSATISSLYDYVDSLDCLKAENYILVSNFPRTSYGSQEHCLTLEEAGLHPQASLYLEVEL